MGVHRSTLVVVVVLLAAGCNQASESGVEPSFGPVPEEAWQSPGIHLGMVPDYVEALGQDGEPVGYIPKAYLFPQPGQEHLQDGAYPVFDRELNLVGRHFPGRGFVPLAEDPASVEPVSVTTVTYPEAVGVRPLSP